MKRAELELAISTAARIIQQDSVLVIGSQAILGSLTEAELPERATQSQEADIAPLSDDSHESLATRIDVFAGEWSEFDAEHGFYIQGVSVRTAYLPEGWAQRVIEVRPAEAPNLRGLCLERHDLCAAKMARNAEKDREFVGALIHADLIEVKTVLERIATIDDVRFSAEQREASLRATRALARTRKR